VAASRETANRSNGTDDKPGRRRSPVSQTPGRSATGRWAVYILECADGSWYTGVTTDIDRRLIQHNTGKASRYTRSRLPVRLVCVRDDLPDRSSALQLERKVKAASPGRKKEVLLGPG
jgi:putative endonuclease